MNIVCIGAHPDDAEFYAGGALLQWRDAGHNVHVLSLTNGDAGHYALSGEPLARRRAAESELSAKLGGFSTRICDNHDGELMPTLEVRKEIVRILRECRADVVLTHRPWDYHPDHRYAAQVVQDASFMVTVPNFCPESPRLEQNPLFLYMMDTFQKPIPFRPDIAVSIDCVLDRKWDLLNAMESQVYEWLPWLMGNLDQVPQTPEARKTWMKAQWSDFFVEFTQRHGKLLEHWYGSEGNRVRYAEFFEICEYGRRIKETEIKDFFPFIPK